MAEYYFISYSSVDGANLCTRLVEGLQSASPPIETWVDFQRLRPGEFWDEQLVEALRDCKGLLFLMTQDSIHPESVCKSEWTRALKYKKPVIPLRMDRDIEIPFNLENREYIDFSGPFDSALQRLSDHLVWMDTPAGVLRSLKIQLSSLERELRRADPASQPGIEDEMRDLQQRIEAQQNLVDDPIGTNLRTQTRIANEIERIQQIKPRTTTRTKTKFINPPPAVAPAWFQDRHIETGLIAEFIREESQRMMIVLGRAGIGKTTMVCRLLKSLESEQFPDGGEPFNVDGIVYLSALGSRQVNFAHMFADLTSFLPENTSRLLQAMHQDSGTDIIEEMSALLENFQDKRIIVLLDNFEDIIDPSTGQIQDMELDTALRAVLQLPQHGVKIIMTTRVAPHSLQLIEAGRQTTLELDKGLESPYAENILRAMDRDGKIGLRDAPDDLLETARERTRGYPRALEALFAILAADRATTLPEILNEASGLLPENVVQVLVGEAFSRLDPLAQKVMQALAVYNHPVPPTAIDYLLQPNENSIDSTPVLKRLVNMQFVRRESENYYLHHVDRTYALERIPLGQPEDWQTEGLTPFTRCGLSHRGAEYFRRVRRDVETLTSIEDFQPLFAEFELLCNSRDFEGALDTLSYLVFFLEREGFYRQIERMANTIIQFAEEPTRSEALGLAGLAFSALGENMAAIQSLREALTQPTLDPELITELKFELAHCYGIENDFDAATNCYQEIIKSDPDDISIQITAQLGLGSIAEMQHDYEKAETIYIDTLKDYVQEAMFERVENEEFVHRPGKLPPGTPFQSPGAWSPITEISLGDPMDPIGITFLLGIYPEPDSEKDGEADDPIALVLLTYDLARIWERIAFYYERMDRLRRAYDAYRMVLFMYDYLEVDTGTAFILESMRRMAPQFSDEEAQVIIEEQERELERARANNHRKLEITIMENLAQSYLERGRLREAETFYSALSQHARELQFTHLGQQAQLGLARVNLLEDDLDSAVERLIDILKQDFLDPAMYADIMNLLSRIEFNRGDRTSAFEYALQAHQTYQALQSPYQSLEIEQLLASIAIEGREYEFAVQQLESAREQAQTLGVQSVLAAILSDLAGAYLSAGLKNEAIEAADEAFQIASKITLSMPTAETLTTVGRILAELREFDLAEDAYAQALMIYDSIGNIQGQINVYNGLTWMYYLMDQPAKQIPPAEKAWELAQVLNDPLLSRSIRMELANTLSDNGFHDEAISHFENILSEVPNEAIYRVNFGWVLFQAGQYDRSLVESQRALDLDETQDMAIRNLGHAYLAKGMPDQAEQEYRRAIQERKGGEHFYETIRVIKKLLAKKPDLPRGEELLALLEAEQARLDKNEDV